MAAADFEERFLGDKVASYVITVCKYYWKWLLQQGGRRHNLALGVRFRKMKDDEQMLFQMDLGCDFKRNWHILLRVLFFKKIFFEKYLLKVFLQKEKNDQKCVYFRCTKTLRKGWSTQTVKRRRQDSRFSGFILLPVILTCCQQSMITDSKIK